MPRGGMRSTSWRPGRSANPGGRPRKPEAIARRRIVVDARELARDCAPEAVETLKTIMRDAKAPPAARIGAATAILDRGYGRPRQDVGISGALDMTRLMDSMDLGQLSEAELDELERLLLKSGPQGRPALPAAAPP